MQKQQKLYKTSCREKRLKKYEQGGTVSCTLRHMYWPPRTCGEKRNWGVMANNILKGVGGRPKFGRGRYLNQLIRNLKEFVSEVPLLHLEEQGFNDQLFISHSQYSQISISFPPRG